MEAPVCVRWKDFTNNKKKQHNKSNSTFKCERHGNRWMAHNESAWLTAAQKRNENWWKKWIKKSSSISAQMSRRDRIICRYYYYLFENPTCQTQFIISFNHIKTLNGTNGQSGGLRSIWIYGPFGAVPFVGNRCEQRWALFHSSHSHIGSNLLLCKSIKYCGMKVIIDCQ